jgi:membrane fusion protein (multidrug efflux system)
MVVGADGSVSQRPVRTGARIGQLWIVEDGLKQGDKVIVEGLLKLRPGMKVKPRVVTLESLTPAMQGN